MLRTNVLSVRMLIILVFCISFSTLAAQENKAEKIGLKLKHNVAYASLTAGANANYERLLFTAPESSFFKSYWVRLGYGIFVIPLDGSYGHTIFGVTALTGSSNGHFELNVGISSLFDKYSFDNNTPTIYGSGPDVRTGVRSDYRDIFPSGSIGYRFQKPEGGFVFRAGTGFPEILYVSGGYSF